MVFARPEAWMASKSAHFFCRSASVEAKKGAWIRYCACQCVVELRSRRRRLEDERKLYFEPDKMTAFLGERIGEKDWGKGLGERFGKETYLVDIV